MFIYRRCIIFMSVLMLLASSSGQSEERSFVSLEEQLGKLEQEVKTLDSSNRITLSSFGENVKDELLMREESLKKPPLRWEADLTTPPADRDNLERRRTQLKTKVRLWTEHIKVTQIREIRQGIADAEVIAQADGLNVAKLTATYEIIKKIIRNGTFAPPAERGINSFADTAGHLVDRLERLDLSTDDRASTQLAAAFGKLIGLGFALEELEAKARNKRQEYRLTLYKRTAVAYVRALISGDEPLPECNLMAPYHPVKVHGFEVEAPGCPDPVVDRYRDYLAAVAKIQSAEIEDVKAKLLDVMKEQGLIADMLNTVPHASLASDMVAMWMMEDLGGRCLSPLDTFITSVFNAAPIIGKPLAAQAIKRSKKAQAALDNIAIVLDTVVNETGPALREFYQSIGVDWTEIAAKKLGVTEEILGELSNYLRPASAFDDAAKQRMKKFRMAREIAEDRKWFEHPDLIQIPDQATRRSIIALRHKAKQRSRTILNQNLKATQGVRAARIGASNMVDDHIDVLEALAAQRDEIYIYRYVNPDSTKRLADGLKTKHMGIKSKSAEGGPIGGLLPVKQELNKQGTKLERLLEKQNSGGLSKVEKEEILKLRAGMQAGADNVNKCLAKPNDCAVAVVFKIKNPNGNGFVPLKVVKDNNTGRQVYGIVNASGQFVDYKNGKRLPITYDGSIEDVMVLADPKTKIPLTADYDFLDIGIRGRHQTPTFNEQTGYTNPVVREVINKTNKAIAKTYEKKGIPPVNVSHHGAERWYPKSPGALDADPLVTLIDPIDGVMVIEYCDAKCMKAWCRNTKMCNPSSICVSGQLDNCIPPDPNRLLKDYYHDRRLRGYDVGPNEVWNTWGHYNGVTGWNFVSYAEELKYLQMLKEGVSLGGIPGTAPIGRSVGDTRHWVRKDFNPSWYTGSWETVTTNFFKGAVIKKFQQEVMTCKNDWDWTDDF